MQLGGALGAAARFEQAGAADGEELFLVEGFFEEGVPSLAGGAGRRGLAGVGDPGVEVAAADIDAPVVGLQFDRDAGVGCLQGGEPGGEPSLCDGFDGDDPDAARPAAVTLGGVVDFGEDPLDVFEVGAAVAVQVDAPLVAVEQLRVEVLLERPDPVADRRGGDAQLGRGVFEALVAGRSLEEAQALKRRQAQQRPRPALTPTVSRHSPPARERVPLTAGAVSLSVSATRRKPMGSARPCLQTLRSLDAISPVCLLCVCCLAWCFRFGGWYLVELLGDLEMNG